MENRSIRRKWKWLLNAAPYPNDPTSRVVLGRGVDENHVGRRLAAIVTSSTHHTHLIGLRRSRRGPRTGETRKVANLTRGEARGDA